MHQRAHRAQEGPPRCTGKGDWITAAKTEESGLTVGKERLLQVNGISHGTILSYTGAFEGLPQFGRSKSGIGGAGPYVTGRPALVGKIVHVNDYAY
jgi:hypothetical protein